jgi:hypothetical protein
MIGHVLQHVKMERSMVSREIAAGAILSVSTAD